MRSIMDKNYWHVVRICEYDTSKGMVFYSTIKPGKIRVKNLYLTNPNYFLGIDYNYFIKFEDGKLLFEEEYDHMEERVKEIKDYEVIER